MHIAYLEDNPTNVALVERIIRSTPHQLTCFSSAEEAYEPLLAGDFHLIFVDVELSGELNGLDLVQKLREAGLATPIIALTAYAMVGDQERCLAAGCTGYLAKPIAVPDLLNLLETFAP
jgi:CheY-like chemotaxis protein